MRRVGPDGIVRIATGADAAALAEIPLEALELGERPLALLGLLGLRTVGQIARLPPGALADRLGPEGARLERLVRQEGPFALPTTARLPVEREEAGLELDGPVDDPEVLLFVIKSLLDRLLAGLRRTHQGLIELAIVLALDDRTEHRHAVVPAEPTLDGAALLDLIRLWLGGAPLAAPVVGLRLVAARHGAIPARQLDLLRQREEREAAALERAIARLGAAFGGGALVRPRLVETYRPEARVGWERVDARALAAAATLAPPAADADAPAPVVLRMGPPERLWWDERGVRRAGEGSRRVVERDGPRRLAGDGWDAAYDRSYWWIGLDDGARWWVFRDELDGGWWLHGIAD
jgi:protein ImuB